MSVNTVYYLDPSRSAGDNFAVMTATNGAKTTAKGAELAQRIQLRAPKVGKIGDNCSILIINAIALGVILALVMGNPVILAVGLGFSAISAGLMVYMGVRFNKLNKAHREEGEKIKTIIQSIQKYLEQERELKVATVIANALSEAASTTDKKKYYSNKDAAYERIGKISDEYDRTKGYGEIIKKAQLIFDAIDATSNNPINALTIATSNVLEMTSNRNRITIVYDTTSKCYIPTVACGTTIGMIANENIMRD
ncbi:MAG: hypothetical protein KR126chlam2_00392 [Chlamydiae bacterium]|nr:hypothetical protein [Chlamydiota bacterium]